jgi:hypothetical protein
MDAGQAVLFWVSGSRRGSARACGRSKLAVHCQATVTIIAINEWL